MCGKIDRTDPEHWTEPSVACACISSRLHGWQGLTSPAGLAPRLFRGRFTPAALPVVADPASTTAGARSPTVKIAASEASTETWASCLADDKARQDSSPGTVFLTCTTGNVDYITPLTPHAGRSAFTHREVSCRANCLPRM